MTTDYEQIGDRYKRAKAQPWRTFIEGPSLLGLLGDPSGKSVIDLACGEGYYSRLLKRAGAELVVGVDSSPHMIELAREAERSEPLGIEYQLADVRELEPPRRFDLVIAAYLLNYASGRDELLAMCRAIGRCLEPGGRFVTVNSRPDLAFLDSRYDKYGFERIFEGEPVEGAPYVWRIHLDDSSFDITNFHLSAATHAWAFSQAGLLDAHWIDPIVSEEGKAKFPPGYWDDFIRHPPSQLLECRAPLPE
jgi:ubiquinone/menaquinone biosynthesis C-methylase UbiE